MTLAALLEPARTVAVVGLAKNAGKTTVVNHLLERLPGRVGLASLGLDGEARDALHGHAKPRVRPPAGALVATVRGLLDGSSARVVCELPHETAVGRVVVVEPTAPEPLVVSGPTRLEELDATVAELRRLGAERVLLDGALGRLGSAAPGRADAVVVAAGVSLARGREQASAQLRVALAALDLPVFEESCTLVLEHAAGYEEEIARQVEAQDVRSLELGGALTGPLLELLLRRGRRLVLVAADATRVLARPQQVARARRGGVEIRVRRPLAIAAVTASPFHPDIAFTAEEALAAAVEAAAGRWPVYDVVAGGAVA